MELRRFDFFSYLTFLFCFVATGCGGPDSGSAGPAVDAVNQDLSTGNCSAAYQAILPVYNSANTNNSVRIAMASTYGCSAKVHLFNIFNDLLNFSEDLGGPGLWDFLVSEFPSTTSPVDDKVPQAGELGIDAIQSVIIPGTIPVSAYMINVTTPNPASLLFSDRTADANSFLTFLGMSLMGSLMSRNGLPSANYHKTVPLPWATADLTAGDGCAFASAVLNFYDGINFVSSVSAPNVAEQYSKVKSFLLGSLDAACQVGCLLCGGTVSCSTCPVTLRSRASCTGSVTDVNSCAAAGIVTFVNSSWAGPP